MCISSGRRCRQRAPRRSLWPCVVTAVSLLAGGIAARAETALKFASLAPEGSSWVRALRDIDKEVRAGSDGQVGLKIYPGGVQGDEDVMLRKIRIGQLHGGVFGGAGVSEIYADILALEMPFLFDSYAEMDHVLAAMDGHLRDGYRKAGYVLLGWADVGFVYLLSKEPLAGPDDIRGRKVWRLHGEPITEVLFTKAGVISVPLTIPDVLLGLQTNLVDVVYASPSAAIVLQWFTRVRYYTDLPINYALGAFVLHQKQFDHLSAAHQALVLEASARHIEAHNQRSRANNEDALQAMRAQGVQAVHVEPADVAAFRDLVDSSVPDLAGSAFSQQSWNEVLRHLAAHRAQAPPATDE